MLGFDHDGVDPTLSERHSAGAVGGWRVQRPGKGWLPGWSIVQVQGSVCQGCIPRGRKGLVFTDYTVTRSGWSV